MASARSRRREKQYEELARENARLHQDVEDLETAFFLHKQVVEEEESSVRGMIRKEVGGSRWQHGGIGKLTTYKSSKDLQDSVAHQLNGSHISGKAGSSTTTKFQNGSSMEAENQDQTDRKPANTGTSLAIRNESNTLLDDNTKSMINDFYNEDNRPGVGDGGKILDLKTKVLKKASSKVIKRDTWHSPSRQAKNIGKAEIVSVSTSPSKVSKDSTEDKTGKRTLKTKAVTKQKNNSFKENKKSNMYVLDKGEELSSEHAVRKRLAGNDIKNGADVVKVNDKTFGTRQSRKDVHVSERKAFLAEFDETKVIDTNSMDKMITRTQNGTRKPAANDIVVCDDVIVANRNKQPEATEIFIDPNTGEVRIRSLGNGTMNDFSKIEQTKVLLQGDVNASAEAPQSFKFSIRERDKSPPIGGEVRDVFGLLDLKTKSVLPDSVKKTTTSLSPFALTKDCDTEVEFWLRGLGLKDVEEYVNVFAENEIDLLDLEFMSAAQLHDMGVTDSEALHILLNGVRELRNLPPDKGSKKEITSVKRGLQAASIAWEETGLDDKTVKSADKRQNGKKTGKINSAESPKNKTFTKGKAEKLKYDAENSAETASSRNNSAMSNYSDYTLENLESSRASSRNHNSVSNAQTRASNGNMYSQYERVSSRPASAKPNKLPPNSKSQVQKKTANTPNKKGKSQDQVSDSKSRLQALEGKPTRSVLLKRSASLTRENGRGQSRKAKDPEEIQNKKPAVRGRSRSAEAVRRKALEGVQAAAKRHGERQMKDRDNEEIKNKIQERKKVERDEMAARHLQREKYKATVVTGTSAAKELPRSPSPASSPDLESLVTVNILSQQEKKETVGKSLEAEEDRSKTRVIVPASQTQKSLRRIEPAKKSTGKATEKSEDRLIHSDYSINLKNYKFQNFEVPVLSTYKLETRTKEGASSEPESGYKTDTSTTYSRVEEKVAEIQLKIKRLKSQALSGDEVTLTLVKDLQTELQHFEKLLTEKEKAIKKEKPEKRDEKSKELKQPTETGQTLGPSKSDQALPVSKASLPVPNLGNQSKVSPRKTTSSAQMNHASVSGHGSSPWKDNVIEDLLIEDSVVKGEEEGLKDKAAMSMSKKELLDEMRKEKHQHHRQIRQLQSELKRMRETDAASTMELSHSDIVYREEDLIGEGTFSRVFRGTYQGAEVAVKRLVVPLAVQDTNYFSAEVSLLRELRHPRVVLLIGVCTSDKLPLMVLEYMSGGSLFNHLHDENSGPLDHAEYYQVARDIALGMNYLHSHKPEVLHLDLKSMNVLLCQSFRAKIADFGFSKLRHDSSAKLAKKGKGHPPRGSPAWMSPELIDKGEISCKADVYSFAIILWEMLTRQLPYESSSVFQVLEKVRKNKRPEILSSCPEGLRLLISRCWDHNPAKRPHFKEIVPLLENLAFPPPWRQLFKKAGVPEEALHNIESTRMLINLVKTTLDSKSFSSFMIVDPKGEKDSSGEATLDTSGENTASTCIPRKTTLKDTDDWESGTISDISEIPTERISEFSLGTLRGSSDESDSDSIGETITENFADDSSDYDSDEDSIVLPLSSERKSPRKKLNVFVPSLELSMKSPVVENAKDEKSTFDWVSISLEDRSHRDEISQRHSPDREVTGLNLSNRSNQIVAPLSPVAVSTARGSERKSWQEKAKEMDEYLMRESINNRRPTSPIRKRLSLTKKLAGRTAKSLDTDHDGRSVNDKSVNNEDFNDNRMALTDRSSRTAFDNTSDLASLNRKLADLNAKYDNFDKRLTNLSQNTNEKFRKLVDDVFDSEKHTAFDGPCRSSVENQSNSVSDRSTRRVELFNDRSYDSFYSLPVQNLPLETSAFRKSETMLPRNDSFTKSKDVLDLLTAQIDHTTKTLEEIENDSGSARAGSVVYKNDDYLAFDEKLSASKTVKQSVDYTNTDQARTSKSDEISTKLVNKSSEKLNTTITSKSVSNEKNPKKNESIAGHMSKTDEKKNSLTATDFIKQDMIQHATIRSVADHYRSKNVFPDKNVIEVDEGTKEVLRQKRLDDYHEFVKTEILHDAGSSIENLKSPKDDKADGKGVESESDKSQQIDTLSDESDKTVTQLDEQVIKDLSADNSELNQNSEKEDKRESANHNSDLGSDEKEIEGDRLAKGNESQETEVAKSAEEEKKSIRVVLNPSDVVGKKPVKTPRRSKMKKNHDLVTTPEDTWASFESKISKSGLAGKHASLNVDIVSKEDAMKKLQDLEDFSEMQTDSTDTAESKATESLSAHLRSGDGRQIVEDDMIKPKNDTNDKASVKGSKIVDKSSKSEKACSTSGKNQKTKLLPKQEHWSKLPEKPKKTTYVLKHPLSKGKRSSDEGNGEVIPASEIKKQQGKTVPKVTKDDYPEIPKKTIRVKLKKDPLAPVLSEGPPSPVPPAPPPPPIGSLSVSTMTFSKSVQVPKTAANMADELKLRVASWQSRSYQRNFIKSKHEPVVHKSVIQSKGQPLLSKRLLDSVVEDENATLEDSLEELGVPDDQNKPQRHKILIPKLSDGMPDFAVQSLDLREQKDHLRSISKPHPDQLDDLSHVSQEQLLSIAELLRKAVMERRLALGEDSASVDQSMDSVSWSVETTPRL